MSVLERVFLTILAVLLLLCGAAWFRTAPPTAKALHKRIATRAMTELVDESTYASALRLSARAASTEESELAQSALRVADHELDLAFTAALSDVAAHPPALNSEAGKFEERVRKSQVLMDQDQQRVSSLQGELTQAKSSQKDAVQDELDLAQSQLELDKDELVEANQDLTEAGGNPQLRIEALVQEHNAQAKSAAHPATAPATSVLDNGSIGKFRDWLKLRQKVEDLLEAGASAQQKAQELASRRSELAKNLDASKSGITELAQHSKTAKSADAPAPPAPRVQHSHDDATALLGQTKQITADQRILTLLDRRVADQRQLNGIYTQWGAIAATQAQTVAHELLLNVLIVLLVLLGLLLLDKWLQHLLDNPKLDRRQVETLRSITRVSLRVLALIIIVLIAIGVPSQFGTMIGIVGAGLTVALKDFIVAFFGWLVLMGRNGIRLGDWVEINGVSGEVIELGIFHTVLLETGNWSDSGHPTGRRVTFTNSFAIERHYFNFSTSGQWLWDELQVVVPAGQDPYAIVEGITQKVSEITAESARLAEQEWQRAVPASRGKVPFSGAPGVNVKPVVGGTEIAVRYITRANERFMLRAKLYQAAVDLLGKKANAS